MNGDFATVNLTLLREDGIPCSQCSMPLLEDVERVRRQIFGIIALLEVIEAGLKQEFSYFLLLTPTVLDP